MDYPSLKKLLDPITPEEFLRDYYGKQSLHIKGSPDKIEKIFGFNFDREWLLERLAEDETRAAPVMDAITYIADTPGDEGEVAGTREVRADLTHETVRQMMTDGGGPLIVALRGITGSDPKLREAYLGVYEELGINGFGISHIFFKGGSQHSAPGRGLHFAANEGFFVQLEGKRRFTLGRGMAMKDAYCQASYFEGHGMLGRYADDTIDLENPMVLDVDPTCTDLSTLYDADLEPGHVLYIPPACVHQTYYVAGGPTMGFNFNFYRDSPATLLQKFLTDRINEAPDKLWKAPYLTAQEMQDDRLNACIDELISALTDLRSDPIYRGRTLAARQAKYMRGVMEEPLPMPAQISDESRFKHDPSSILKFYEPPNPEQGPATLFTGKSELDLADSGAWKFFRNLADNRFFTLAEAKSWDPDLGDEDVVGLVEFLAGQGVIRPAA